MFQAFKQRSYEFERLDTGDYTPVEFRRWLRDMRLIHRVFGEIRALRRSLFNDLSADGGERISVLDVGAGTGELLGEIEKWTEGRNTFFAGVELAYDTARSIKTGTIGAVQADALRLPFTNKSFDYVFCTLFLHHLGDSEAVKLLKEMSRVAAKRIYAIDLNRHPIPYYLFKTLGRLIFQPFTIDDGALSILRCFSPDELRGLARAAGLREVKVEHSRANRLILSGR